MTTIAPHVQRMLDEYEELSERLGKLSAFLKTETFFGLEKEDRQLLFKQDDAMDMYKTALHARIVRVLPEFEG